MIGPAVELDGVHAGYGFRGARRTVLRNVTLRAAPGTVTGLVGRNGAGKTTLVRVVLGTIAPWQGAATVGGERPRAYRRRQGHGYLPELVALPRGWTLEPFVRCGAALAGIAPSRSAGAAREALRLVGLADEGARGLSSLSKGMGRRAALAFALAGSPGLLVLDEPMSGLDAAARVALRDVVARWKAHGATIVVSSHELAEVVRMADTVSVVAGGGIVARYEDAMPSAEELERTIVEAAT